MASSRFYPNFKPLSAEAIADLVRGEIVRGHGHDTAKTVKVPKDAKVGDLCFVANENSAASVSDTKGIICLTKPDLTAALPDNITVIVVPDPKMALGLVIRAMQETDQMSATIHPTAIISDTATLGEGCHISAHVVIEDNAVLGEGCRLGPGVVIGQHCVLGDRVSVDANTTIHFTEIGSNTEIAANVVLGHIGFAVGRDQGNIIIPHLGIVRIGSHVHIGATTTIDRGFIEDTVIGDRVMIDNKCQIGHNVTIGEGTVICAQAGVAGSVKIGRNNIFGAQCGVADNLTIGDGNMFAARTGITKDVGSGKIMGGFPAVPVQEFRRQMANIRRLGRK